MCWGNFIFWCLSNIISQFHSVYEIHAPLNDKAVERRMFCYYAKHVQNIGLLHKVCYYYFTGLSSTSFSNQTQGIFLIFKRLKTGANALNFSSNFINSRLWWKVWRIWDKPSNSKNEKTRKNHVWWSLMKFVRDQTFHQIKFVHQTKFSCLKAVWSICWNSIK